MPRRNDDDDDDDRPARNRRRPRNDDDDDDRPARSRRRRDDGRAVRRKKKSNLPLVLGIVGGVLFLGCAGGIVAVIYVHNAVKEVGEQANERRESSDNLKRIGLVMHKYQDRFSHFPHSTYDGKTGRPLLSWRVHVLPYFEEHALYSQFRLDEPWDGPNNRQLLSKMPRIYATSDMRLEDGKTHYRGFAHPGAVYEKPTPPANRKTIGVQNITDGLANTIVLVESAVPIEWSKPDDLEWLPGQPMPTLGLSASDRVLVLMADGSVRTFRKSMPEATWRGLITYSGNEIVNPN